MKSEQLDLVTVQEIVSCLRNAAGEVEHTIELLEPKVSSDDLAAYKRMVGKVIIALYSGLADPVLEGFPDFKKTLYQDRDEG